MDRHQSGNSRGRLEGAATSARLALKVEHNGHNFMVNGLLRIRRAHLAPGHSARAQRHGEHIHLELDL